MSYSRDLDAEFDGDIIRPGIKRSRGLEDEDCDEEQKKGQKTILEISYIGLPNQQKKRDYLPNLIQERRGLEDDYDEEQKKLKVEISYIGHQQKKQQTILGISYIGGYLPNLLEAGAHARNGGKQIATISEAAAHARYERARARRSLNVAPSEDIDGTFGFGFGGLNQQFHFHPRARTFQPTQKYKERVDDYKHTLEKMIFPK